MAFSSSLTTTRVYTQADPYYYTVDNRPIGDLNDRDVQLANELDRRTLAIDITGASTPTVNRVPTGWTVAVNGAGDYTITHNMGNTNYVVQGIAYNSIPGTVYVVATTSTTIQVKTCNSSGTATHMRFQLVVVGY